VELCFCLEGLIEGFTNERFFGYGFFWYDGFDDIVCIYELGTPGTTSI